MSILAEPRRKQRLSVDPQNLQWRDDEKKFSKRLMERMGWSEGEGLGRNRQGIVEQLKLQRNNSGRGLGADKLTPNDETWIKHHDDFADLLNSLNRVKEKGSVEDGEKEELEKISLESTSKSIRRRIHYQRFTRAKDISNYSKNDLSAVIGIGLSTPRLEDPIKTDPIDEIQKKNAIQTKFGLNTTVSKMSVGEYFTAKMAAMKTESDQATNGMKVHKEAQLGVEEQIGERKRLKKRVKLKTQQKKQLEFQNNQELEAQEECEDERRILTSKSKRIGRRIAKSEDDAALRQEVSTRSMTKKVKKTT
ncbi:g-patch domain protein [Dictyocaulus viviparus]|uniref:G-patch domain protein n=1 Tax=Dictyocaulus viviparus TaxID=29172 RepID=A0A0D8XMJ3_DICVI|nr:g-patch domain protein [Dictyocaulus viviparus]